MTLGENWPQTNLAALYHLENVNDSSGNSRTLTNNGTVTFTAAKFTNGANLGTTNTTKYLSTTNTLGVNGGACTISIWVKMNTEIASATQVFASQSNTSNKVLNRIFYDYNAGTRRVVFRRGKVGTSNDDVSYTLTMGTTAYYNFVYVYDATNVIGYVNGNPIGSTAASGNGGSAVTDGFYVGATQDGSLFASATIDEVAFYTVALSAQTIRKKYAEQAGKFY